VRVSKKLLCDDVDVIKVKITMAQSTDGENEN